MNIAIPIICLAVLAVSILGIIAHLTASPEQKARIAERKARRKAEAERYCTKHVIKTGWTGYGPERLVWVWGPHRTPGNACDGPEHHRRP